MGVPRTGSSGSHRGHTCSPSGPTLPGSPARPCKTKKDKDTSTGAQAVGDALLPQPICSCIFVHQISLPVPCSFGEAKCLGLYPKENPNQLGVWARALTPMLDGFYSGCRTDPSLLVDTHRAIAHPLFLEEDVTLILPRAFPSTAESSLGTHLDTSGPWLACGSIRASGTLGGGKREAKIRTQRIWLTGKSSCHFSLGHQDSP